jgi:hypothetical protein
MDSKTRKRLKNLGARYLAGRAVRERIAECPADEEWFWCELEDLLLHFGYVR